MPARHRSRLVLAPLLLMAAGLLPAAAWASDPVTAPAAPAAPAEAAAAPIEIVRGGGVLETYRRDGADFPAYGPDGAPRVAPPEEQARRALAGAHDAEFVSLDAAPGGKQAVPCPTSDCVGGIPVLGRVPIQDRPRIRLANSVLGAWLREPGGQVSACLPEYRHALTFSDDGHAWEVLLCYGCGQYLIRRDGVELAAADAAERPGLAEINALFAAAGIPHRTGD